MGARSVKVRSAFHVCVAFNVTLIPVTTDVAGIPDTVNVWLTPTTFPSGIGRLIAPDDTAGIVVGAGAGAVNCVFNCNVPPSHTAGAAGVNTAAAGEAFTTTN